MNRIVTKKIISECLVKLEIKTAIHINEIKPGQYITIRLAENGIEISLPVLLTNAEKETINVIVCITDETSRKLASLSAGNAIFRIDGPFGYPAQIENYGTVLCVARGVGIIALLPLLLALRANGNRIITILSARSKTGIILENEIKIVSDELIAVTDDGSNSKKASIYQIVEQVISDNRINHVFVNGTARSIKETCSQIAKKVIPFQTILYLGKTGEANIHNIFRIRTCGTNRSICVDGFNFNAYYPNFEEMIKRFEGGELDSIQSINVPNEVPLQV